MTPKEYKQMMDYLTRSGVRKQIKFASDIARPDPKPVVKEIETINEFVRRNPRADGGMLVQPGFGGTRQGYRSDKTQTAKEIESIKLKTEPLTAPEKKKLFKSYDDLFRQEYKRLLSIGDPFSKIDLNRAVINRIAKENPTINLQEGIGLDKISKRTTNKNIENKSKSFSKIFSSTFRLFREMSEPESPTQ